MDVGAELRQARLARGLTLEQISAETRVASARLDAIERNNMLGMPLIYVRGYVREFARTVGLDPDDLTERYIAQFTTTTSALVLADLANMADDEAQIAEIEEPITAQRVTVSDTSLAADYPLRDHQDPDPAPPGPIESRFWRSRQGQWATLVVVTITAAAIGFMIGWNSDRQASVGNVQEEEVGERRSDAEHAGGATNETAPAPATPASVPDAPASREDASIATRAPNPALTETTASVPVDLDGTWTMTNEVQDSSVKTFRGLRLQYQLQLQQDGRRVTGKGQKVSENGRSVRKAARTPITVAGTVDGDKVHLTFREQGRRRESGGTFQFQLAGDGSLRGTFESDAARSSGQSIVRRAP